MGAPVPGPAAPVIGVTVSLGDIYAKVVETHEKVTALAPVPSQVEGLERRVRSLENWRLVSVSLAMASMGSAAASLFQLPILNK